MSLTDKDLQLIRLAVREEASSIVDAKLREHLTPVSDELEALRNDIKEIYDMLASINKRIGKNSILDPDFLELSDKQQLLRINDIVLTTAKRLGVTLPR